MGPPKNSSMTPGHSEADEGLTAGGKTRQNDSREYVSEVVTEITIRGDSRHSIRSMFSKENQEHKNTPVYLRGLC